MSVEIKVPELGESITEVQIANWLVKEGDEVARDQDLVSVDSEKATVEIPAPSAGKLSKIIKASGEAARVGEVIGQIDSSNGEATEAATVAKPASSKGKEPDMAARRAEKSGPRDGTETPKKTAERKTLDRKSAASEEAEGSEAERAEAPPGSQIPSSEPVKPPKPERAERPSPREDVESEQEASVESEASDEGGSQSKIASQANAGPGRDRGDEVKPMTSMRRTVARRLAEARMTMAILTTFNEIDMTAVIALRKQNQEAFQARHGVKLGLMSFFVKAAINALRLVPQLNAEIRGDDIVLHRYVDIGVAIGAGKGLVVPPLRNAEGMSFAEIEAAIADLAARAQKNKLKPDELEGGTFTISNGGVYGSMLSTPIINPPQSGILGLHAIQERPVAHDGQVVIRPMMFVALSYDHRIVDGREAVTFLVRVKEIIEDPARLLFEI